LHPIIAPVELAGEPNVRIIHVGLAKLNQNCMHQVDQRWRSAKMFKATVLLFLCIAGPQVMAIPVNEEGSTGYFSGQVYTVLCEDGSIYMTTNSNPNLWVFTNQLPVPVNEIAEWAGTQFITKNGEYWGIRGSAGWQSPPFGLPFPAPLEEIETWAGAWLRTTTGELWYFSSLVVPGWYLAENLDPPCALPVENQENSLGGYRSFFK